MNDEDSQGYVELHCHSCFSLLDGASTPEELVDRARALDMSALALTDHDGLYAAIRFNVAARERGVRPILGAEVTLEGGAHLILLAESRAGYRNLCWLISRSQLSGSKGQARASLAWLDGRTAGLIALTGCLRGCLAGPLLAGRRDEALAAIQRLQQLFGPGQLYVELQQHLHPQDQELIAELVELARQVGLPIVATNNVHYASRDAHRLHDVLVATGHNMDLQGAREWLRANSEYHLKSPREMAALFSSYPEALANTLVISERCQVELSLRDEALPPQAIEGGDSLSTLCARSLPRHYPRNPDAARRQLEHELQIIRQVGLEDYFLLVWDIVRYAREQGIQVRGRGSAANSIVAYLLGITNVDPLAHNLLFERFLSAEARVMPDIDLDFCARRREEVIQYLYQRYGEEHVGMVCNYVTYRQRSAVRDVGKALGWPPEAVDRLARASGHWGEGEVTQAIQRQGDAPAPTGAKAVQPVAEKGSLARDGPSVEGGPSVAGGLEGISGRVWQQFLELSTAIQGLPRHLSIHVGGMCITKSPLDEIVPLERATMPGRVVIQWDKDNVEDAGLIKIDLLCLRTLSAIDECLHTIQRTRGEAVDLDALPLDDPLVYTALQRADTIGAFQVESRAQQQALVKMRPRRLEDIVVEVALIRPGPLQGNMVHPYLRRRMGLEPVQYLHPLLKPILQETLGVVVFQEQVIRIAMAMGGFSAGEADLLRRAMSRHRSGSDMAAFRERFVTGATDRGVNQGVAEGIFQKLEGFASYGFCKSHAAAFAKTAYDTLYLRAHYPAEYYCALLNNQPMGFYAPRVLVGDARRHGVKVLPVHVGLSQEYCAVEHGSIRLGFCYVDGLGEAGRARLLEAREVGAFRDPADLCRRTRLPRRVVESLILAGGMDHWSTDRRRWLWELGRLRYQEDELPLPFPPDGVALEPMTYAEQLTEEFGATGVLADGQFMELFREHLSGLGVSTSQDLGKLYTGKRVKVAGLVVVRQAPPTAKGFRFFTLEDEWGLINVIVNPSAYQAHRAAWNAGAVLMVQGMLQHTAGRSDILAECAWKMR